jgi:hypothetical protein
LLGKQQADFSQKIEPRAGHAVAGHKWIGIGIADVWITDDWLSNRQVPA